MHLPKHNQTQSDRPRGRGSFVFILWLTMTVMALGSAWLTVPSPVKAEGQATVPTLSLYLPWIVGTQNSDLDQSTTFAVPGLSHPNGLSVHRDKQVFFLTSRDTNTLFKLSSTGQVLASVTTGSQPWGVAVDDNSNRVYVSNFGGGVTVYDVDTLALLADIAVGSGPGQIAVNEYTDTAAVILHGENKIAFIDGLIFTEKVDANGSGAFGIAADVATNHFVVTHRDSRTARIFYKTDAGWKNDGAEFTFADLVVPFAVTIDHRNARVYILTWRPGDLWRIEVFEKLSQGEVKAGALIPVGNSGNKNSADVGGVGLAVNVNNRHIFVANSADDTVTIIDGVNDAVLDTVTVGDDPTVLAMNRDNGVVFVGLRASDQMYRFRDQCGGVQAERCRWPVVDSAPCHFPSATFYSPLLTSSTPRTSRSTSDSSL